MCFGSVLQFERIFSDNVDNEVDFNLQMAEIIINENSQLRIIFPDDLNPKS